MLALAAAQQPILDIAIQLAWTLEPVFMILGQSAGMAAALGMDSARICWVFC